MKKLSTPDFIEKSLLKHDDIYDYSLVEYINSNTKVKIICISHGIFEQYPLNHTKGSGCPSCKGVKKITIEDFIKRSNNIHNYKFNYNLVNIKNNDSIVDIICTKHGIFQQRVSSHLEGFGCSMCSNENNKRLNEYNFIQKSKLRFNNKYDYSLIEYIDLNTKVKIICKKHGIFEKTPKNHLTGQGCKKCSSMSTDKFIEICKIKHNNKYDYSLVEYEHSLKDVKIICPIHGEFRQIPTSHLKGNGCQECGKIGYNSDEFIELVKSKHNNKYDYSKSIYNGTKDKINIICPEHGEFTQIAGDHIQGHGCKICGDKYGIKESRWLDSLNIKNRQVKIDKYIVDGYDRNTNTIYEFNGDFWHGNPNKYKKDDINPICGKTFGYLLQKTIEKEKRLKELGYNVVSIWESEY